ncbi:MAG: hypothetical protein HQL02_13445 [Nitrospirae bacterium]|nr:hypothetical protein [Nitrospirota bacterium]
MLSLDMQLTPNAVPHEHINIFWGQFITFAKGGKGKHYLSKLPGGYPFSNWKVGQRYCNRKDITKETVEAHRQAALKVKQVLDTVILNGGIR